MCMCVCASQDMQFSYLRSLKREISHIKQDTHCKSGINHAHSLLTSLMADSTSTANAIAIATQVEPHKQQQQHVM